LRCEVFDVGIRKVREKHIHASETENKLWQHYEAMERRAAHTTMIQNCKSEQETAKVVEKALHQTARELKELSVVMMQTALFWKRIHDYGRSLLEERVKLMVRTMASTKEEEDRIRTWTSQPFKEQAIRFYAGWVALNTVCSEYAEHIKNTQEELYKCIVDNPTCEEARRSILEVLHRSKERMDSQTEAL
jgi:hypothetical protein